MSGKISYVDAGVDIDRGDRWVGSIRRLVQSTHKEKFLAVSAASPAFIGLEEVNCSRGVATEWAQSLNLR